MATTLFVDRQGTILGDLIADVIDGCSLPVKGIGLASAITPRLIGLK
jgi:hypothetical protein